ncbi:MAG: prolipoprotein diacylglyceryl transferase [Deltaproteobacteria bacterium]|nr:prolipoprotein diacylglyceryl transferase [Deltaproteobacteria bacterium]
MHLVLFTVGTLKVHSYGVAIALAFVAGIVLGVRSAQRQAVGGDRFLDLSFWLLIGSLLGARLLYVATQGRYFVDQCLHGVTGTPRRLTHILLDCSRPLHLWEGGLVYYGGLLGAIAAAWWFARRRKVRFLRLADLAIPLVALGHAIGRLGCFAAGCCYGRPTTGPLGVRFPRESLAFQEFVQQGDLSIAAHHTPPLHPTQLYEVAAELTLFFVLLLLNTRRRYFGQTLLVYLAAYGTLRFVMEFWRADPDRSYLIELGSAPLARLLGASGTPPLLLSTSQAIAIATLVVAIVVWWLLRRGRRAISS